MARTARPPILSSDDDEEPQRGRSRGVARAPWLGQPQQQPAQAAQQGWQQWQQGYAEPLPPVRLRQGPPAPWGFDDGGGYSDDDDEGDANPFSVEKLAVDRSPEAQQRAEVRQQQQRLAAQPQLRFQLHSPPAAMPAAAPAPARAAPQVRARRSGAAAAPITPPAAAAAAPPADSMSPLVAMGKIFNTQTNKVISINGAVYTRLVGEGYVADLRNGILIAPEVAEELAAQQAGGGDAGGGVGRGSGGRGARSQRAASSGAARRRPAGGV